jgi:hypothetical protein
MFMNYMDYVDDKAMVMFSAGQVTRMQAALDGLRSAIGTTTPCGKSLPKEVIKEGIKEGVKDPIKEIIKEGPKDPPKDWPKEPIKESPKDPPKDWPKDPPKDWPKDPPKEWIKEFQKEFAKEFPKDFSKDPPKDWPKSFASDLPPKSFVSDLPPKSFSDPPKSFMEPPIDLPIGPGSPITGGGPFTQPGFGGMPFVLATGAAAGAGPQMGRASQKEALAGAYQQLLALFASLQAAGQLDATGLAAWQETAATYQRLLASST